MKLKFSKSIFFLFVAFLISIAASAQSEMKLPPVPNPPRLVNDLGGFLTTTQQAELEQRLLALNDSTSVEITIVTVPDLGGVDIAQYGLALGNKWRVGKAGKENGIVILASKADKKMSISTGRGIEGSVTDLISGRIIRNEMRPAFQQGDFYGGFLAAADAIALASKGEYQADAKAQEKGPGGFPIMFIILIIVIVIISISKRGGKGGGGTYVGRRGGDLLTGAILGGLLGGRGGGGLGGGFGGGGGGGFGGFGGGSFGGGGASGGW